jgi:protein-S-isoprenylcysteine O-methyltransferase Ste14
MFASLLATDAAAGAILTTLLLLTSLHPSLRIWPPPSPWGWRSLLFWSLFRTVNVTALALTLLDWQRWSGLSLERWLGLGVALAGAGLYGFACWELGRGNLYCGREGLVTHGIYRWTRNPQYATAIPAYLGVALASHSWGALILAVLLALTFLMMALAEEPWLEAAYGEQYRAYRRRVARFYHWRPVLRLMRGEIARLERALKEALP